MHFPKEIEPYLPDSSIGLIQSYWNKYPFEMKLTGHRQTKSGDYRFIPKGKRHLISVNTSLNQYQFLFTLIHEIAHQWVKIRYSRRQNPHGKAWKDMFRHLTEPFLDRHIFPEEVKKEIVRHMKNPKASSSSDARLYKAFNAGNENVTYLHDLEEGSTFIVGKRRFIKGPKRRTRFLCYAIPDKRKYTISSIAPVKLISTDTPGNI